MPRGAVALAIVSLSSTAALARGEDRDVPEFSAVSVAAGIRASVEVGPRKPVHIEADDEVLPLWRRASRMARCTSGSNRTPA